MTQAILLGVLAGLLVFGALVCAAWGYAVLLGIIRRRRTAVLVVPPSVPRALDQEQYAALLRADEAAKTHYVQLSGGQGARILAEAGTRSHHHYCGRCWKRARIVHITHPICDGPFDDGGSGTVDVRHRFWCVRCDGPPPASAGAPIRLPYLGIAPATGENMPIRLLPELYARPAFHQLMMPVELYVAPARATAALIDCPDCFGGRADTCPEHSDAALQAQNLLNRRPAGVDPETLCQNCRHAFMWHVGAGGQGGCTISSERVPPCRCARFLPAITLIDPYRPVRNPHAGPDVEDQ
jgi:hypothetical protein